MDEEEFAYNVNGEIEKNKKYLNKDENVAPSVKPLMKM